MNLHPGDCFYFEENLALAILIEKLPTPGPEGQVIWRYALRSPRPSQTDIMIVSIRADYENKFVSAVDTGRFAYYKGKM